ncbi:MAG: flagellar basal body rod protein FlgC [Phenylobacterium sp.]|jgi:flagellar basal-body rod protein FlgC|uniref:flagellar basal body rod protein FlgC n=1 Tax=Phenylobacterium sp. TaxID=1871053 RepID=UPI0025D3AD11|nr:flagellar basal body rod protein FlgC [Phenylobacterium sp.]MCG9917156.1 flagellar basal body rod protein FlgC [Phenylobacterium sp.]
MAEIKSTQGAAQAIAATALRAQQARMRVIAENMANANSTSQQAGGDPYRRQVPVFEPSRIDAGQGVRMARVQPDQSAFRTEYEPGHPSADAQGYVKLPNVNTLVEAMDMREAQRAYEANLNVIETARAMEMRVLDLLKR